MGLFGVFHYSSNHMKLLLSAIALVLTMAASPAGNALSSKKGICMGAKGGDLEAAAKTIKSLNVSWHYNWTPTWRGRDLKGIAFVPMVWGEKNMDALDGLRVVKSKGEANPLLAYNEPDGKGQANMTVARALELWPMLEKTNRRLGSPATVHADNEWMTAFMKGAKEKDYRVDFICVHWYGGNDPDNFIKRLENIHGLYEKPIWITEFAVGDWSAKNVKDNKNSPQDVLKFMKEVLPRLDKLDFVERYAWFSSDDTNPNLGTSALFDESGKLTELGEFYANHKK